MQEYTLSSVKLQQKNKEVSYGLFLKQGDIVYLFDTDLKQFNLFSNVASLYENFVKEELIITDDDLYELKLNLLEYLQIYTSKIYLVQQVELMFTELKKVEKLANEFKTQEFLHLLKNGQLKNNLVKKFVNDVLPGAKNGNKIKRKLNDIHSKNELLNNPALYNKMNALVKKNFK